MSTYAITKTIPGADFDDVLARTRDALQAEGFGAAGSGPRGGSENQIAGRTGSDIRRGFTARWTGREKIRLANIF